MPTLSNRSNADFFDLIIVTFILTESPIANQKLKPLPSQSLRSFYFSRLADDNSTSPANGCSTVLKRVIVPLSLAMVTFVYVVWDFYTLTGRFFPVKKIDSLGSATPVIGWNATGLTLKGGRMLPLPELRSLPVESVALAQVTQRGVEIGTNGRIYGLVRIHHWCGNDPVREHIAKIDISDMLLFLRIGEPSSSISDTEAGEFLTKNPGGRFSEFGWDVSEYYQFNAWAPLKDMELEDKTP